MTTIETYSKKTKIPVKTLLGKSRKFTITLAREIYWLYLHKNGLSYSEIAAIFKRKQHSTISSGINTAKNMITTKEKQALTLINILDINPNEIF